MFGLPKDGTALSRAGSIPALAISRGFSMGILLSKKAHGFITSTVRRMKV